MLDGMMRRVIDPPLNHMGRWLARRGVGPDAVTLVGLVLGLVAAGGIAMGATVLALVPLLLGRVADGLDGAVARASRSSDFGGYLDILADFVFYGAIPLAFVILDPASNGLAGAFLLFSFYINGTSFLGYAILAERRKMTTTSRGTKTLYFTGGLLEGTETIAFFVALCLLPHWFAPMAWVFGTLCLVTAASRLLLAKRVFGDE